LIKSIHLESLPAGRAVGLLYRNDYPQTEAALAVAREIKAALNQKQRKSTAAR
jgi:hypothetical protein